MNKQMKLRYTHYKASSLMRSKIKDAIDEYKELMKGLANVNVDIDVKFSFTKEEK